MLNRRRLLAASTALLAAAKGVRAQGRPLTFCSWGGALSELEKTALLEPFAASRGLSFNYASPTNYAKLRAMVEGGAPEWDLVDTGGRFIFEGADYLEPLDMTLIPNAAALDPGWVTPRGIFTSTGATIMAWNTSAIPGPGPQSWKDFWDVKTFPGARGLYKPFYYNYEIALMAAGLSHQEVYPVTDEKVQQAIGKLKELKPNITVWWTAGAQPAQLLSTGELAMAAAWSGRIAAVMKDKAPVGMTLADGIAWGNAWVVPKGAPQAKLAMEAINAAISQPFQERLLADGLYGPVLASAAAKATPEQQAQLVTAPANAARMLIINEEQAALYSAKYQYRLDGVPARLMPQSPRLAPLLSPRSIAFVGASARPDTPGNNMLRMVRRGGFRGEVFAVNPGYTEIEGFACLPSLSDLPASPDLVVLSVRNERLEAALSEAVSVGAGAAVVFASAVLPDDPGLAARLAALAGSMPVCGPNCMGFYNDLDHVWICGFPSARLPQPGAIALVAHSGSVFGALCHNDPRLRFAFAVSPGQELTATVADYVEAALARPEVRVIGLFIEAARDPAGLRRALRHAAAACIPVVVLKVGRTEAAAAAALTHTGAIAGSDAAWDALFDETGVIRVEDLDGLAATLLLLSGGRRAAPGGLVSIHDSGGERELTIDLADRAGVAFAEIADATRARIQARLDPGLVADNPLDAWGTGRDFVPTFAASFKDLLADPAAALGFFCADFRDDYYLHAGFAEAALAAADATDKPVACVTTYTQLRHDKIALALTERGVPVLDGTANALAAARGMLAFRDAQARAPDPVVPALPADGRAAWRTKLEQRAALDEAAALDLLSAWGVNAAPRHRADCEDEAAAAPFEFPLVLKTATTGIAHKSDIGGVALGLADEAALRRAYRDMAGRLGPSVLVMPMLPHATELAMGMVVDPQFGPMVVLSAGGTLIELLEDRAQALAPFGPATARRLISRLRLSRLLSGYRGAAACDIDALALMVSRFSVLAADLADLVSAIDVNPVLCGPHPVAVDALIIKA